MFENAARTKTRPVRVGEVTIGGGAPVVVQSMTSTDTVDAAATLDQVRALADAGCDIVRVSVPSRAALKSFRTICAESPVPIVADIHFDHRLALGAIEAGAAKLRINPGNIGSWEKVDAVIDAAGEAGVDFFSRGDCTWNLLGEAGDVDLNKGDFTWKGDPTVTEAINL